MSALFQTLALRDVAFRNRIMMAPMVQGGGDDAGCVTPELIEFYGARADAGTAMIIVEATAVARTGRAWPGCLGAYAEAHLPGLAALAARIKAGGAIACLQLVHGGPQAYVPLCGPETLGPSAVKPNSNYPFPRALTLKEIGHLQECFAQSAALARQAGFDAVEVHGAHGYLLDSFLSPVRNLRTDGYGGPAPCRLRMLAETIAQVRARAGSRMLVGCRISAFNHLHEDYTLAFFELLLRALNTSGADLIHLSTDRWHKPQFGTSQTLGQLAKARTRLPVILAGGLGVHTEAERAVAEGHTDFAAVGRAMKSDPNWTQRAQRKAAAWK